MKISLTTTEAKQVLIEAIKAKYDDAFRKSADIDGYNYRPSTYDLEMSNDFLLNSEPVEFTVTNVVRLERPSSE